MRMIGWLGVVSIGAVLLLRGAEGADDKRLVPVDSEMRALSQKIAALEARLRVLEGVVQVTGPNVKLMSSQSLTLQAGTNIAIHGGSNVAVQSSADVAIQGAKVDISGGGSVDIRGGMLLLNRGGMPLARLGDPVVVDGKNGVITGGSPTILGK